MIEALKIAASGMSAQQLRVDVTSHNIANMSTTAFDARRAEFTDLAYEQVRMPGTIVAATGEQLPTGVQIGLGVRPSAVTFQPAQGTSTQTGGQFDLAIQGSGWFQVKLPSGDIAYTRDGSFELSPDGVMVTSGGYPLADSITVPAGASAVQINADGIVYAKFDNNVQPQQIGTIQLATFVNEKGLEATGDNLFRETTASGQPQVDAPGIDGRGTIQQGYLEQSSVNVVSEITELIEAQRGYELNARVMSAADEMLQSMTRIS